MSNASIEKIVIGMFAFLVVAELLLFAVGGSSGSLLSAIFAFEVAAWFIFMIRNRGLAKATDGSGMVTHIAWAVIPVAVIVCGLVAHEATGAAVWKWTAYAAIQVLLLTTAFDVWRKSRAKAVA